MGASGTIAGTVSQYVLIDSAGIVLAHFGARNALESGVHYREQLCPELRVAADELVLLREGRSRVIRAGEELVEIRLAEVIRLQRTACDLKRKLAEWLYSLAYVSSGAGVRLEVKLSRDVPSELSVDADKIMWVVGTIVQNAVLSVERGSFFRQGGRVVVSVEFDKEAHSVALVVEHDGGKRAESSLGEASIHGPNGRMNGAAQFARAIVEAHGGRMLWEHFRDTARGKDGTRVSLSIPAR